jgi:hypothetical protein
MTDENLLQVALLHTHLAFVICNMLGVLLQICSTSSFWT